ncbi:Mce family protein Mce3C [Mycobacterium saskatchewanense]|uniref:Mammalian cell entry protein n=1 Tax=Mycobacterium saskatchewanense TaxID=220927 RepID=A0AAJ3NSB6_9MYCO|nr:MCE family protein [Mycobacterium saskatchewanense]ORW73696.1 mammalian cell entry protein [Mycobacterium saskatchewanense]BBX65150.1 Mce family protein Mce3C [Mycobacterium saskatchewanense]
MKSFEERNPLIVGAVGVALVTGIVAAAFNYQKLPFFDQTKDYSAYFAEAGGLADNSVVEVSGLRVGQVNSIALDGGRVLVRFSLADDIRLGDGTEAAIKTKSLLGAKILDVTPRGGGALTGPIPLERTTSPYQLPDALGDLSNIISGLDTQRVSDSLAVLADTFKDTPPDLQAAVQGVARFSQTLDARDQQLRALLHNANKATTVLAERSDQVVKLLHDSDALLLQLRTQSSALDHIAANISALSEQIKGLIAENRDTLKPAVDKLNEVLTIVDNRKSRLQDSIKRLNTFAMSLGESVSSGPFFKAYVVNLLPGQFVQPFVDAAFSDLGLDPNVLSPTQRVDPQTGQPATPPLPLPYPRTGQGGDPRLKLPDAITGKPGDHACLLPGPDCYPYREPPPAPPPGGPPPGPPAPVPPELRGAPPPTPSPVFVPAPGEPGSTPASGPAPLPNPSPPQAGR